ncbi:membrane protein [Candidatus Magnetobacterium bavaricum]|uniref:Membrane protein n=1 Tax=Candidatus Magnetobacterium bavaricum TaxID=29290 RepID=A0A0F3GMD2_9BACT|nr:membrane protein [Candidatus Magnetobacterium bavaricum]
MTSFHCLCRTTELFSCKQKIIKNKVDYDTAVKYRNHFNQSGALCAIEAIDEVEVPPLFIDVTDDEPKHPLRRSDDDTKVCPSCGENVKKLAAKCRYCGHHFDKKFQQGEIKPSSNSNQQSQRPLDRTSSVNTEEWSNDDLLNVAKQKKYLGISVFCFVFLTGFLPPILVGVTSPIIHYEVNELVQIAQALTYICYLVFMVCTSIFTVKLSIALRIETWKYMLVVILSFFLLGLPSLVIWIKSGRLLKANGIKVGIDGRG